MSKTTYNISLKGYVGGYDFDRSTVDKTLAKFEGKEVNVLIDSLGGSLATGLFISAAFKNHGKVNVHFVGLNASAATIASLGAAHISIDAGAMYLVHQSSMAFFEWGTTAYSDLAVVKSLLPMLGSASRDFHRWRTNEMLIATYKMAEKRKDSKTMERAATAYGKLNRVGLEDEQAIPLDQILVQPFMATDDPRVLSIEPIPNIAEKISAMIEKYRKKTIDIDDVEFEEVDLEFDALFPDNEVESPKADKSGNEYYDKIS